MALIANFSTAGNKRLPAATPASGPRVKFCAANICCFFGRLVNRLLLAMLIMLPVAVRAWGSIATDTSVSSDLSSAATQITSPVFSTSSGNELLLALVATDANSLPMTVTSVSGGGLTWVPVARANGTGGTSEIWRAFAVAPLSNVTVTAHLAQSVFASLQVMSFSGVDASGSNGSGAIGAVATASGSGAPSANLTTTRGNSLVLGVGNDFNASTARTLGPNQTLIHQDLSTANHDTYWMQRLTNAVPASGTKVTINDTAPKTDPFNFAICEILAPSGTTTPSVSSLSPNSGVIGTSVIIAGTGFGAAQGNGGVTFNGSGATISSWSNTSIVAVVPYGATTGNVVVAAGDGQPSSGSPFTVTAAAGGLAIDASSVGDLPVAGTQLSSATFSTSAGNEVLLAFIASDALSAGMTVSGVNGGGLTWTLVKRANAQLGDAEIWRAFAASPLINVTVTATLSQSVVASIQVVSFTGADLSGTNGSGAIGAVAAGNANPGAPTASLVTTRAGSWVFGVGNDYDKSISRTLGPGQALLNQYWSPTNDTYWMQRQNNTTPASGTTVTINDTAPATDRYNLAIVEVLPGNAAVPLINSLSPSAGQVGDVVAISGANFGSSAGSNTVSFGGVQATPISNSISLIQVPVPPGVALGTVSVIVSTSGGTSNSAPFTVVSPLAVTATAFPPANPAGWNNTSVTITYVCTGGVAPVNCPLTKTVTTEGANQAISATAADAVGNIATATTQLKLDLTAPTISAAIIPRPGVNGVVIAPATITFTCADSLSGISTCPAPISATGTTTSSDGSSSFTGTATDQAGNSASTSVTINLEAAPLAITATTLPQANAAGWNRSPVTITFECSGGVEPYDCPAAQTLSTDGPAQTVNGTVVDSIGQSASTTITVNIDQSPPIIKAAISPPPNAGNVNIVTATVSFTCSDALSGIAVCPPPVPVNTLGVQTIRGTAVDNAGNSATASTPVRIEGTALTVVATIAPVPNQAGWNNTPVTVTFQCSGGVPPIQCPAPQLVNSDGTHPLTGTALDAAGATAVAPVVVNLDQTPPVVNVISPSNFANLTSGQTTIQGLFFDAASGVNALTCNGTPAQIAGSAFSCGVTLSPGSNAVVIAASDVAGNSASSSQNLSFSIPINVQITSPTPQQLFSLNPITVTGTVDKPNATVTVGGVQAVVANGAFTASGVVLAEDKNLLTASAISPDGGVGAATVTLYLDTTPPVVHIDSPTNAAIVTSPQITVTGNVNDLVTGTVNGDQVNVSVNGVLAKVVNRSFAAQNVLLVPGKNTVTAIATDRAGNVGQHQIQITLQVATGQQTLTVVSGNNQNGPIRSLLPQPLIARATDAIGRPIPNRAVAFTVVKSDGIIFSGQQQGRTLTVQTDSNGNASVQFQLGSRTGAAVNQIAVSAPGFVGQTVFSADSTIGPATQIHTVSGEMQVGGVGSGLPEPLVAIVFDAGGNPVANIPVTFAVKSGGGLINSQATYTQNTDSDGKASALLVTSQQEGISNNLVIASFPGMVAQPASFVSSTVVPGPVANTTVSGIVLDDANEPIVNATASIKGTNLSALTNSGGHFTIANAPVGDIVLFIDGSTSTDAEPYPTLSFQMATIAGVENTLPGPIFLPEIDTDNSQVVGGDQDVILTMKNVPGVAYKVLAHSVTFPDGTTTGRLSLSQVHSDRVPMTPPNGTAPRLVGTLQPAGVRFNPPIQMTLPNTDGLAPGQVVELFSFHHEVEQFVVEGTARVSDDGSVLVSDPGFGLSVSGWHGGGGNQPPGTCADGCQGSDSCKQGQCVNGACQFTNQPDGTGCDDKDGCTVHDKCTNGACGGDQVTIGTVTPQADLNNPDNVAFDLTNNVSPQISFSVAPPQSNCDNLTYTWDFGDGSPTATGQNVTHQYTAANSYTATVTIKCDGCDTVTGTGTVVVNVMELQITSPCTANPQACAIDGSSNPAMPTIQGISVKVVGANPDPTASTSFVWQAKVQVTAADCSHVTAKQNIVGDTIVAPVVTDTIVGGQFTPDFTGSYGGTLYGGQLELTAQATVNNVNLQISTKQQPSNNNEHMLGTDPSQSDLMASLPHNTLRAISCREGVGGHQFRADFTPQAVAAACPLWSGDGARGVGIMQMTPYTAWGGNSIVWNWPNNVNAGISKFNSVEHNTTHYATLIGGTNTYRTMIRTINATRAAQQPPLPPLVVTITPFTNGDYNTNLQEVQLNQIRGYNGYAGRDVFGIPLREYQLRMDANNLPVLNIDNQHNTATTFFDRVQAAQRPQGTGDPNYVNNVLGQPPLNGGNACQ